MDWKFQLLLAQVLLIYVQSQQCEAEHWAQKRETHKHMSLSLTRLRRVAEMSDMDEFKKELKPFMKKRVSDTQGNREVQDYILKFMKDLNWHVDTDKFKDTTPYDDKWFTNIIATHDINARRRLTLACHFDSKYFEEFEFIGATDSAVPCAMLLDIARLLTTALNDRKEYKDVTLQLLFLDGEEAFKDWTAKDSIYGARHLADKMEKTPYHADENHETNELHSFDCFVLLDLIGTANPTFYNWFEKTSSHFQRLIKAEDRLRKSGKIRKRNKKYFSTSQLRGSGIEDDHIPFLRKNVPIVHLIAYPFPSVWHTKDDTWKALDYETIEELLQILRVFVSEYLHLNV